MTALALPVVNSTDDRPVLDDNAVVDSGGCREEESRKDPPPLLVRILS